MKKLWIILLISVILISIITLSVRLVLKKKEADKFSNEDMVNNQNFTTSTQPATPNLEAVSQKLNKILNQDEDLDGISDTDEKKYGTNPTSSDTDGDGLLDNDEITIYKTNPIIADTDEDGVVDGEEVDRGFNPLSK